MMGGGERFWLKRISLAADGGVILCRASWGNVRHCTDIKFRAARFSAFQIGISDIFESSLLIFRRSAPLNLCVQFPQQSYRLSEHKNMCGFAVSLT